jgi:hypothetical protein
MNLYHLGTHEHHIVVGLSKKNKEMAHDLIRQKYKKTSIATPSTITMSTIKVFLASKSIALGDAHNPSGKERNLICCWNSYFL